MPTWPKGDDRCGCVSGFHNGNVHPEEDAGLTQTINTRSLHQIVREVAGVLAEHHDQERGGDAGQNERPHTVQQVGLGHHFEQRNHRCDLRHHHGQQQDTEQSILVLIMIQLKAKSCKRANEHGDHGLHDCIQERIAHGTCKVLRCDQILEVLNRISTEHDLAASNIQRCVGGSGNHPQQRKDRNERDQDQGNVSRNQSALGRVLLALFTLCKSMDFSRIMLMKKITLD